MKQQLARLRGKRSLGVPIIPTVGRKSLRMRLLDFLIYVVLAIGGVTVVYPFLLMLSTSITSGPDTNDFRLVPRYLRDNNVLFAKYVDDKYGGDLEAVNSAYGTDFKKAIDVAMPDGVAQPKAQLFLSEWKAFLATVPLEHASCGFRGYGVHPSELALAYRSYLRDKFNNDIEKLNKAYTEENATFEQVMPPAERPASRTWVADSSTKMVDFQRWKASLDRHWLVYLGGDGLYQRYLMDFANVPRAKALSTTLTAQCPTDPNEKGLWEDFVRNKLPIRCIRLPREAVRTFQIYLSIRYKDVSKLNALYKTSYSRFEEVPFPSRLLPDDLASRDYADFISKAAPLEQIRVWSPEIGFRQYLKSKYGDIGKINREFGLSASTFEQISPPTQIEDATYVLDHLEPLKKRHVSRNYGIVIDYILLHGRAVWVTVLFCASAVLTALIVNPLCAYALSRFNLSYSYSVLLFVLATMAFPAEVVMIPNFLLLKELGMLNTFAALILPGMANGFSIFLLKGFFDSLPNELYEAGTIDGATELKMFFKVTVPMSKPIFAVIALGAFTAAYGAFMFALLVCQDPDMWTLMVWLYDLQGTAPQYVMMAALTVAAIPTLTVFAFAQKVIIRGIVIPMEK